MALSTLAGSTTNAAFATPHPPSEPAPGGPAVAGSAIAGEAVQLFTDFRLEDIAQGPEGLHALLRQDAGYLVGGQHVGRSFYADPVVARLFQTQANIRLRGGQYPDVFNWIAHPMAHYMVQHGRPGAEGANDISHTELARKITKAAFCFKIDPKMILAKIEQESDFLRTAVSNTGAVGLSQMTGAGIQEVVDQLGIRGDDHAPAESIDFFNRAAACYFGNDNALDSVLWGRVNIPRNRKMTDREESVVKTLLRSNIDLDIVFGQVLMKVVLTVTKRGNMNVLQNYHAAFVAYNGDNTRARGSKVPFKQIYARQVMAAFRRVSQATFVQVPEQL